MNRRKVCAFFSIVLLLALSRSVAYAIDGSSRADGNQHFKPEEIARFAKKVEKNLAKKGVQVALIARIGRPEKELPEGIRFTHTGIAAYSQITTVDGRKMLGYAVHNLYQRTDNPAVSDLMQDFPVDFFSGAAVLKAGVIIPSPELQKRMLDVITSPTAKKLHNQHYSVIANPFTLEFQNCTEYVLDVIASAIYNTDDLNVIKANEKAYFEPQPVYINPVKLMVGSMFAADVTISDHPGSPVTATFDTIGKFLAKYHAASEIITITPDGIAQEYK